MMFLRILIAWITVQVARSFSLQPTRSIPSVTLRRQGHSMFGTLNSSKFLMNSHITVLRASVNENLYKFDKSAQIFSEAKVS